MQFILLVLASCFILANANPPTVECNDTRGSSDNMSSQLTLSSSSTSTSSSSSSSSSDSASNSNIVPAKTSQQRCDKNEVFKDCKVKCPPERCEDKDRQYKCRSDIPCEPGCNCEVGYYRNGNSTTAPCIPKDQCPSETTPTQTCGCNEIYVVNATKCDSACSTKDDEISCGYEFTGCQCIPDYVRDCEGNCIPVKDCPEPPSPNPCGVNERWSACHFDCPPQLCESSYTEYDCITPQTFKPGCDCKPGYLRNGTAKNKCIPNELCPVPTPIPTCSQNEVYVEETIICEKTCETKYKDSCSTCSITTGCVCQDGFVRNSRNECVKPCSCRRQCGENEHFDTGADPCPPRTCHARLERWDCNSFDKTPKPKCRCNDGYVTNNNKTCILETDC